MPGVTIIELVMYVGLLGLMSSLLFSFTLQMHRNSRGVLAKHVKMSTLQTALDVLTRDLRLCKDITLSKDPKTKIACQTNLGTVQWQLHKNFLRRVESKLLRPRPGIAKVAEQIKNLSIKQLGRKNGPTLLKVKITDLEGQVVKKTVLIRRTIQL